VDPQHVESRETLWQKFQRLQEAQTSPWGAARLPPSLESLRDSGRGTQPVRRGGPCTAATGLDRARCNQQAREFRGFAHGPWPIDHGDKTRAPTPIPEYQARRW